MLFFGRIVSFAMAFVAGIFAEIPIVSDWAFWFMVGAYLVWLAVHRISKNRFGCDCGGLRRNPNSQQLRTLDYDSRLYYHRLQHRQLAIAHHRDGLLIPIEVRPHVGAALAAR
jgi:hypothetical protein